MQGYARIEAEVASLRGVVSRLLDAQMPVLSWWAIIAVLTRSATTMSMLSIFLLGIYLNSQGLATIGEIVTFMNFAGLLVIRLEQVVGFSNRVLMDAPRLKEFFDVLDTVPAVRDRADAVDPGRVRGLIEFNDVSFSYDGKRAAVADLSFQALPGETIALVGSTGAGKSTALALLHRAFDPQSGSIKIDGMDISAIKLAALRHNIGVVYQEALLFNRSIADNLRVGNPDATEEQLREAAARAQATDLIERHPEGLEGIGRRARTLALRRRAAAPLDRARAVEGSADPDPRRGDQLARRHDRAQGAGRARRGDEGPHHLRDRAPARDRAQRHPHPGVRSGAHHRGRLVRRAGRAQRPLRRARARAVPRDRARPGDQSGNGRHEVALRRTHSPNACASGQMNSGAPCATMRPT